jgi:hypothetical protein
MADNFLSLELSRVGQIMEAYNGAATASSGALKYALECGKHLNAAKETIDAAGKNKWKKWCEKNLPAVSEETERLYRRLATAVEKKPDIFATHRSIHSARDHLGKFDADLNPKPERKSPPKKQETGNSVTGLSPPGSDTPATDPDFAHLAGDEIVDKLKDDADKLEEVAKASFKKLGAEKVSAALIDAWNADKLQELVRLVSSHLSKVTVPGYRRTASAQASA